MGHRLRYNYAWIFPIQALAYFGKLAIHPVPLTSADELWARADIGLVSGQAVVIAGVVFHSSWACFAAVVYYPDKLQRGRLHDRH